METGGELSGSLVAAGVVDEIVFYFAPKLLGDALEAIRWLLRRYRLVHVDGKNATFMRKG